ncbi:glycosyltransferase [Winogradskyella maritima]|uniref:Glycosyltransferase n=1 Tax=Winogradskyella maritima TaxID=1517766 RepID=A0ABV8AHX5_9FLAO|nr:glycosyltransferase [Winogradskyella maritima]
MRLVIISHTEHYKLPNGELVGWGPTVTEINHLAQDFESIVHLAMLRDMPAPPSALPYTPSNIQFKAIPAVGGSGFGAKIRVLSHAFKTISIINKVLKQADAYQLRLPTGIGVYLLPYLTHFSSKKGWYKYAGNWNQTKPPLGYRLQRWFLKRQSRPVTINGCWPTQQTHCLTFENPCLTQEELKTGQQCRATKAKTDQLVLCYVGRLESQKGVGRLLKALETLPPETQARIAKVHLVGDGPERHKFETLAQGIPIDIRYHGYLPRHEVFELYKASHYFIMPTLASEGFPKVLAEAANFGCVPIVTNLSSISQYIKEGESGYLISPNDMDALAERLHRILSSTDSEYRSVVDGASSFVSRFTFIHYREKIQELVKGM